MPNLHVRWAEFLNGLNATNIRIFVTLICVIITTVAYTFNFSEVSWEWLAFLATMSGLDAAQYTSQRVTYVPRKDHVETKKNKKSKEDIRPKIDMFEAELMGDDLVDEENTNN